MNKKCLISLFLIVIMLITSLPVFAAFEFSFTGSDATFYSVSEDGTETGITESALGTIKAKMSFVNTTLFAQEVSLYLCTKDAETGKLKQVNVKNAEIKPDGTKKEVSIDISVEDEMNEQIYLYVWNSDNVPFCEPAFLDNSNAFIIYAKMTNTYKNDSRLLTDKIPRVQLELYNAPTEKELAKYQAYEDFYDKSVDTYIDMFFKVSEGKTNASQYTDCFVIAKLTETDEGYLEIASITTDTAKTKTLTVDKDFSDLYTDGNSVTFEYWDGENDAYPASTDITADALVYINGTCCGTALESDDINDYFLSVMDNSFNGSIQFSGRANGNYDVVYINQYEYGMVTDINVQDEAIELDNGYIELAEEYNRKNFIYNIYKNGNKVTLEDIKKDDILSFAWPLGDMMDARFVDIYVSDKTVTGTVMGAASDGSIYYINNVEYKTANGKILKVGAEGVFFLTHDGKVYDSRATSTLSDNYAYILKVGISSGFDSEYHLRVLQKNGKVATYTIADKVKITADFDGYIETKTFSNSNGTQDTIFGLDENSEWNIPAMLEESDNRDEAIEKASKRLITFDVNSEGKINKITFAAPNGVEGEDFNIDVTYGSYKPTISKLGKYYFTKDTTLFYAPVTEFYRENYYDTYVTYGIYEDDIEILPFDYLDENCDFYVYAYAICDRYMGATLIANKLDFMGRNNPLAVVTSVAVGLNSEGERATAITVLQSGQKSTYCLNEDIDAIYGNELTDGDVVQFVVDDAGEIAQFEVIFDYTDMRLNDVGRTDKVKFICGYVLDYMNGGFGLAAEYAKDAAITDYIFNYDESSTLAMVDVSREGAPSFAKALSSPDLFKYTNVDSLAPIQYYMVARVVDGDIVDAVEYNMGQVNFAN